MIPKSYPGLELVAVANIYMHICIYVLQIRTPQHMGVDNPHSSISVGQVLQQEADRKQTRLVLYIDKQEVPPSGLCLSKFNVSYSAYLKGKRKAGADHDGKSVSYPDDNKKYS